MVIRANRNLGLNALLAVSRVSGPVCPYHLGFMLGPRINAGGRIGDAALGAKLLTSNDQSQAEHIASELERLNKERQALEQIMLEDAITQAERQLLENPEGAGLVTSSSDWHAGIVGLLASRLKERFRRPAFAIAIGP